MAAAQGLQGFFGAQAACAGLTVKVSVRTALPTATPANTTNGTIVVDNSILFLDNILSLPPKTKTGCAEKPWNWHSARIACCYKKDSNLTAESRLCGIKVAHNFVMDRRA